MDTFRAISIVKRALRYAGYWGALFLLLSAYGCMQKPEPLLRIATNIWPGYETLYLARSLGLYDKAPIRLVEMPSASQSLHALRNGVVEAAALTLDEALNLLQDRVDLRVVLVMDVSNGADALIARAEIGDLADLRHKRVGVENTATGAVVLDAVLERAGLQAEDIMILPKTINDHLLAWQNQEVDALITFDPVRSKLIEQGGHELFDSSQIPGRILDILVVRADVIDQHKATLKTLISGYFAALEHIRQQPEDAARRLAPRMAIEPRQALALFDGVKLPNAEENRQWLSGSPSALNQAASNLAALMSRHQLLQFDIKIDSLAEPGFLPAIQQ